MAIKRRGNGRAAAWRIVGLAGAALLLGGAAAAQQDSGIGLRFDFGPAVGTMNEEIESYARWSSQSLADVQESWSIDFEGGGGATGGAALFFQFNPFISLEMEARGTVTEPEITSDYDVYWRWEDGSTYSNSYRGFEIEEPEMSTFVASLNLLLHLTDRGPVKPFVTFGVSAFDSELQGAYDTAWAYTYVDGEGQHLRWDYPVVDFEGDTQTTGVNVGAGGDYFFNNNMAVTFMAKYYHSERESIPLRVRGDYPELRDLELEVNPSFWMASGGIKFLF
jgi:opacity protein-like surface antigen